MADDGGSHTKNITQEAKAELSQIIIQPVWNHLQKERKEQRSKLLIALYTPVTQPYPVAKTLKPTVNWRLLSIQTPRYNP